MYKNQQIKTLEVLMKIKNLSFFVAKIVFITFQQHNVSKTPKARTGNYPPDRQAYEMRNEYEN